MEEGKLYTAHVQVSNRSHGVGAALARVSQAHWALDQSINGLALSTYIARRKAGTGEWENGWHENSVKLGGKAHNWLDENRLSAS